MVAMVADFDPEAPRGGGLGCDGLEVSLLAPSFNQAGEPLTLRVLCQEEALPHVSPRLRALQARARQAGLYWSSWTQNLALGRGIGMNDGVATPLKLVHCHVVGRPDLAGPFFEDAE